MSRILRAVAALVVVLGLVIGGVKGFRKLQGRKSFNASGG